MIRTQAKAKLWLLNSKDEPIIGEGKAGLLKSIREEGIAEQGMQESENFL
jgi:molybdenum-dependent DNA-binding transcriptional regulator ModE